MHDNSQAVIYLIVGAIWLINAIWRKYQQGRAQDEARNRPAPPKPAQAPAQTLTRADRDYRQVQEEIRRKIAERAQPSAAPRPAVPAGPAPAAPVPADFARALRDRLTQTANELIEAEKRRRAAAGEIVATAMPEPAPARAVSESAYAQSRLATEQADSAYDQPKSISDQAAAAYGQSDDVFGQSEAAYARILHAPEPGIALRALLGSPSAARKAFLLREIFGRPNCDRPVVSGGHEEWM